MTGHGSGERVVVTGATGFIGQALVGALRDHSDVADIRVVSSRAAPARALGPLITWWQADIRQAEKARGAMDGATVVFHLAGRRLDEASTPAELAAVNEGGSEQLARLASDCGVKRFVHFSSTGVFGSVRRGRLDEGSSSCPENAYETSKLAAECRISRVASETGLRVLTLRPSNVFGPRHPQRNLLTLFRWLRRGVVLLPGSAGWLNFVFVDDLVDVAVSLGLGGSHFHDGCLIVNCPMPAREFLAHASKAIGVRPRLIPVPAAVVGAAAGAAEAIARIVGVKPPITRRKMKELGQTNWFDSKRLIDTMPTWPRIGVPEGLQRTADYYQNQGWL